MCLWNLGDRSCTCMPCIPSSTSLLIYRFINAHCSVSAKEVATIRLPVRERKDERGYRFINFELLEPWSLIKYLWNEVGIEIPSEQVQNFWQEHRRRGSPWARHTNAEEDYIPLGIYGDACRIRQMPHQPVDKCLGLFINCPLWRPRSSRASRWLICTINEKLLYKRKTLNMIIGRLVWSINLLWDDKYPACGFDGKPCAKFAAHQGERITGKRFCITEVRGDWLWHQQVFKFSSTWVAGVNKPVCFLCPAFKTGDCKYYNVTESSPLWGFQYNFAEFLLKETPSKDPSY